jgi:general secretion pathway protein A
VYLKFHNLREYPFALSCDPKYFYNSAIHSEALANMLYTVGQRKGMVLVSGEVGSGKTFVGNMLGERLGPGCLVAVLKHPPQSGKQMLRGVAKRIGMNLKSSLDKLDLAEMLEDHLTRLFHRGRLVVLIVDESQDLTAASLEELRLIWNWEEQGQRLVQIVLMGQPELRDKLQEPKWEPLRQRIVLSYHLNNLSAEDTAAYIAHRLRVAGDDGGPKCEFSAEALADIHAASDGIPRLVNVLCDNALLVAYSKGVHTIDRETVGSVLKDMTCWGMHVSDSAAPQQHGDMASRSGQE